MYCKNCGKELNEDAKFCDKCGTSTKQQDVNNTNEEQNNVSNKPKTKKGCIGCLIIIIIFFIFVCFACIIASDSSETTNENMSEEIKYEPVFNSQMFYSENQGTVSPKELIELMGQPDSINNYDYESFKNGYSEKYPIIEYIYGDWSYKFNNDCLHRISFMASTAIKYDSKEDFLKMFGCEENIYTDINDTNSAYRAYDCGVKSLWIGYDEQGIQWVHIDYSDLF